MADASISHTGGNVVPRISKVTPSRAQIGLLLLTSTTRRYAGYIWFLLFSCFHFFSFRFRCLMSAFELTLK